MANIEYFSINAPKELFIELCVYYFWKFALMFLLLAVVLFCSREHENCSPQPGWVRAHIESKIQFLMALDLSFKVQKSWIHLHFNWS